MRAILTKKFYQRQTSRVAKELLGKWLVRKTGISTIAGMITEVEVYDGFGDRASHAWRRKTKRNKVMFEEGGVWYVYLVYGMHEMLNIVTREEGYPAAILIRGVLVAHAHMNGPGKITQFFKIDRRLNGKRAERKNGLWIEDRGLRPKHIKKGRRIGVEYAGRWKHALLRLYIDPSSVYRRERSFVASTARS